MHNYDFSNQTPFNSVTDAIAHFVETPIEPFGTEDLVKLNVRPIPFFKQDGEHLNVYKKRIKSKN